MRLARISLAIKYRILFGAAVLLIIGAALYVPWFVLEALVIEQPFREARRLGDDYFRNSMASEHGGAAVQHAGLPHGEPDALPHPPRFVPIAPDAEQLDALDDNTFMREFIARSFRRYLRHPNQMSLYEPLRTPEGRFFAYSHAVRVTSACLSCHGPNSAVPYRENQLAGLIALALPAQRTDQQLLLYRLAIGAAGGLAMSLAVLVFYVITHRFILSPIEELRSVSMRVAGGEMEVRSRVASGDEFEQLANSMNAMLENLNASQLELRKANRLLDEKLGEMAETNVALYEANRLKSEFLANVSHELRTPLTSIIGFAELLRENSSAESNGRLLRYAENILISGRILLEIINDLLDLAKIEAGRIELRLETVRVDELCQVLTDFMRPLADKKSLRIDLHAEPDLPLLITDRGKLRQVLFNLLSNAVKFTPEGGVVALRAQRREPGVELEVEDNGPGISEENQRVIFEKFRQVDQSATREHHGTGLGLAIAKELTSLLGGEIGVTSEIGHGSTFWVRLPPACPEGRERAPISLV